MTKLLNKWMERRARVRCWHAAWNAWNRGDDLNAAQLYQIGDRGTAVIDERIIYATFPVGITVEFRW